MATSLSSNHLPFHALLEDPAQSTKELRRNNFTLAAVCSSTSVASYAWSAQVV
jgi:hypothetical protein